MARKKTENTEEKIVKAKTIGPYDIIKMMFTDSNSFDKLSNLLLSRNFFMINRIFAIQHPIQAQFFNQMNINQANVIRAWKNFATAKHVYGRVPSFVYTKGAKRTAEKDNTDNISKELKELYCKHNYISIEDLNDMLYFYHDYTCDELKRYENLIKADSIEKIS